MADTGMMGMFAPTPDDIRASQYASAQQNALNFAQLDPSQQSTYLMGMAGANAMPLIAKATGGANRAEAEATANEQLQNQIDHSTPEGLMAGAAAFNQMGNARMATMYVQAAQAMKAKQADAQLTAAKTQNELQQYGTQREIKLAEIAQRAEAARMASEDRRYSADQRAEAARQHNELLKTLAELKGSQKTPAQQFKEDNAFQKTDATLNQSSVVVDDGIKKITELASHPGFRALTDLQGKAAKYAYGTDMNRAEGLREELYNYMMGEGFKNIRASGGIGSMTEKEWPIVANQIASMDFAGRGYNYAIGQLNKAMERLIKAQNIDIDSYNRRYGQSYGTRERIQFTPIPLVEESSKDAPISKKKPTGISRTSIQSQSRTPPDINNLINNAPR